jgi:DNA-binding response OmpR family regulator
VAVAGDGREALETLEERAADAVVLDVLMPRIDGLELCRRLRGRGDRTPVLMITARDAVADRVAGLDAGADDYLVKPFALEELLARLRALLRRAAPGGDRAPLRFADLKLDPLSYEVRRGERASDALAARAAAKSAFTSLFLGLGAVALLVGGVGIANVMVISVLEGRSEIGLRRSPRLQQR